MANSIKKAVIALSQLYNSTLGLLNVWLTKVYAEGNYNVNSMYY